MSTSTSSKVIVGLSGGVDSSVAAFILKKSGFQVEGLFMKNWDEDDGTEYCQAMTDFEDALQVSKKLGIECHTVSFSKQYWDRVFEHFLDEYRAGRTPNPDILCNKEIKFKAFLEHAIDLGADYIATGHYAQSASVNGQTWLFKGSDPSKDQSYFLYAVQERALAKTLFPVGGLLKAEVRKIARQQGLSTHKKKDSTGICFIGERKFKDFLMNYLPAQYGNIRTEDGAIIGSHQGLMYHTIGQRQGLGIGGLKKFGESPWYVIDKNMSDNELIVAQGNNHPSLFRDMLIARKVEWLDPGFDEKTGMISRPFRCSAKIRYRQQDQYCRILATNDHIVVAFDQPQRAISPGQSIVFYDGQRCLGGGIISAEKNTPNREESTLILDKKQSAAERKQRSYNA